MIVVGCLSVFEAEATLAKTLNSIRDFVDYIIVVDGAYEGFGDHIRSQDRTGMLVSGFPKPKIQIGNSTGHGWASEVVKRNLYLYDPAKRDKGFIIDKGDWVFIIDADEYIVSGIEETRDMLTATKESVLSVTITDPFVEKPDWARNTAQRVRLFRYVPGMKYAVNHFTIEYPDGSMMPLKNMPPAPLVVCHDQRYVSDSYKAARKRYNAEVRPKVETE